VPSCALAVDLSCQVDCGVMDLDVLAIGVMCREGEDLPQECFSVRAYTLILGEVL
jgi:hypothetical protein